MKVMETGEPVTMAYGAWGALNARAGFLVRDESQLPEDIRDYVDKLVVPYFRAIVAWYETIGMGYSELIPIELHPVLYHNLYW